MDTIHYIAQLLDGNEVAFIGGVAEYLIRKSHNYVIHRLPNDIDIICDLSDPFIFGYLQSITVDPLNKRSYIQSTELKSGIKIDIFNKKKIKIEYVKVEENYYPILDIKTLQIYEIYGMEESKENSDVHNKHKDRLMFLKNQNFI